MLTQNTTNANVSPANSEDTPNAKAISPPVNSISPTLQYYWRLFVHRLERCKSFSATYFIQWYY